MLAGSAVRMMRNTEKTQGKKYTTVHVIISGIYSFSINTSVCPLDLQLIKRLSFKSVVRIDPEDISRSIFTSGKLQAGKELLQRCFCDDSE